jgi:para-nitrobenzyl esterase
MTRFRALFISSLVTLPLCAANNLIKVEQGQVAGIAGTSPEVRVYKGMPYAAPPAGSLRWAPPKPAAAWSGVKEAKAFGNDCMQNPYPADSLYFEPARPVSEDCLYLNIWTAAKTPSDKRPVMVWIHGGALTRGAGATPMYDGEQFAKKGVVLVTINYRLGIFGFFAHPELTQESEHKASGNYAVLDQIAALEWVKKNIAAFGGDPAKITIFGESAGSWSVNYLTASPLAKGLFQRAIGESGAGFAPMKTLAETEPLGLKAGASLKELRAKSAADVQRILWNTVPVVDGWIFPTDIYTIYAQGKQNDVPLLVGSNNDEATAFFQWPKTGTLTTLNILAKSNYGAMSDDFMKTWPASDIKEAEAAVQSAMRDQIFTWNMRTWARMQEKTGKNKAWLYRFNRVPPGKDSAKYRVYHASEIQYVFDNLDAIRPWESVDHALAKEMNAYWVNFAKNGDPNGKGLPEWPVYDEKSDQSISLGDTTTVEQGLDKAGVDFFDRFYKHAD